MITPWAMIRNVSYSNKQFKWTIEGKTPEGFNNSPLGYALGFTIESRWGLSSYKIMYR